jgi:hypothetical protein
MSIQRGPIEDLIKNAFDDQIIKEYLADFKRYQWSSKGGPMPHYKIWGHLVEMLEISGTNAQRYPRGLDKDYKRPVSPLTDENELKNPPLEPVLRYIAAADVVIDLFPPGRLIVNRAASLALRRIRKGLDGYQGDPPTACEVERLRFLRNWCIKHPGAGLSSTTVRDMPSWPAYKLMEPAEDSARFLDGLNSLLDEWDDSFDLLVEKLAYRWFF